MVNQSLNICQCYIDPYHISVPGFTVICDCELFEHHVSVTACSVHWSKISWCLHDVWGRTV